MSTIWSQGQGTLHLLGYEKTLPFQSASSPGLWPGPYCPPPNKPNGPVSIFDSNFLVEELKDASSLFR